VRPLYILVACKIRGSFERGFPFLHYVAMKNYSMEKMEIAADASEILISKVFRDACENAIDALVRNIKVPDDPQERKKLAKIIAAKAAIAASAKISDKQGAVKLSRVDRRALKNQAID
jgi:hypothetical protein